MKVAHVSDCYLPRTGGIETQVRALALHQAAAGHDVRIITATPGDAEAAGAADRLPIQRVTMAVPFDLPIHLRTRHHVAALLADDPVDVVHVHAGVVSPFAWGALRAVHQRGIACLVTVHSVWGGLARPAFTLSDLVLGWSRWGLQLSAVSGVAASRIAAAVPAAGPVLVIPNGIEAGQWQVDHHAGRDEELRIVTVMRLAPRKRLMPFLRIVRRAQAQLGSDRTLVTTIIGDGPERARAERYAARRLRSPVTFTGRLDRAQILAMFGQADAYVQPSVKESFGIAALEARTAGLPVVARSQTGTAHFIRDGVEGLLVDSDDAMAAAISTLATDAPLRAGIAAHNAATRPDSSWDEVLAVVDLAYAQAAARMSSG